MKRFTEPPNARSSRDRVETPIIEEQRIVNERLSRRKVPGGPNTAPRAKDNVGIIVKGGGEEEERWVEDMRAMITRREEGIERNEGRLEERP